MSDRNQIYRVAVDAAGNADIIQLPDGAGVFRRITLSIEASTHAWTLYSPSLTSSPKTFGPGKEKVFDGTYRDGDVLGYIALDNGSDYAILLCER